ncbi:MAG: AraC family transcriptional regulator [Clostridiales bacterium]|nr:AraC family transcriptional regulator [Clostridiales bacterium]
MENISSKEITPFLLSICVRTFQNKRAWRSKKFTYTYRIMYVTEGAVKLKTEDTELICRAGSLLFLPPELIYTTLLDSPTVRLYHLFYDLCLPRDWSEAATFPPGGVFLTGLDVKVSAHPYVCDMEFLNRPTVISTFRHASDRFERMLREYTENRPYCRLKLNAMLGELLAEVARAQDSITKTSHAQNPVSKPIIEYIRQNYTGKITCRSIGERFHYHPNYVSYLVKQATGMTVREYITSLRVAEVSRLLDETDMSITEIAQSLGFYDSSHLCNVYYKTTGCTPRGRRHYSVNI